LEEEINKIFDPFYTTNLSTDTSGLGLSVIYNQVNLKLNGSIVCDNSNTGGAQFKIKIPMS
jgi:signal transduction histidine kinase